MYEDEEGRWQNRIDELWVSIDDRAKTAGSKAIAFFNKVAEVVTAGLDRLFGDRLFSVRSIGASTSYSFATALIVACSPIVHRVNVNPLIYYPLGIFLISAITPTIFRSRWVVPISLLPLLFTAAYLYANWSVEKWQNRGGPILFGALVLGFIFIVVVIMGIRISVRRVAVDNKGRQILAAMLIQLGCALALLGGPLLLVRSLHWGARVANRSLLANIIVFSTLFNVFAACLCFALSFTLTGVLVYRIFWPAASRVFYPLARLRDHS